MKKLIALLSLVLTLGLVGCSSKSEVKDIPVSDIKSAINNETLLPIQPIFDIDAKEFYVFENVKDDIKEGFVLQAMINVKLQDVFVVKTDNVEKVKLESVGDYVYFIATNNAKDIESKILEMIK